MNKVNNIIKLIELLFFALFVILFLLPLFFFIDAFGTMDMKFELSKIGQASREKIEKYEQYFEREKKNKK